MLYGLARSGGVTLPGQLRGIRQTLALDAAAHIFRALPVLDRTPDNSAARDDLCLGCQERP